MPKFNQNIKVKYDQYKNLAGYVSIGFICIFVVFSLFYEGGSNRQSSSKTKNTFSGIVDETFAESDVESAMASQQLEFSELKKDNDKLKSQMVGALKRQDKSSVDSISKEQMEKEITEKVLAKIKLTSNSESSQNNKENSSQGDKNSFLGFEAISSQQTFNKKVSHRLNKGSSINHVNYPYYKSDVGKYAKNSDNYVPSGTFVKAVVLGGADADASISGERSNNGVMLFKLINDGVLPNSQRSHLKGCFVTASTYGDISSERAYVVLDKISCAQKNRPMIDKAVTGWAFFGGKVGIKGKPLMRDGKIVQMAGISGALSGIAGAAQYAQSVQSFSSLGATSVVPGDKMASYSGLGGASKAAEQLSSYYIKRAEQFHPVIQVGSGNLVNIVFKSGFSLNDNSEKEQVVASADNKLSSFEQNQNIPQSILNEITSGQQAVKMGDDISSQIAKGQ